MGLIAGFFSQPRCNGMVIAWVGIGFDAVTGGSPSREHLQYESLLYHNYIIPCTNHVASWAVTCEAGFDADLRMARPSRM